MGKQSSRSSPGVPVLGPILGFLFGRRMGPLLLVAATLSIGGYFTWSYVKDRVLSEPRYRVTIQSIAVTPPPEWIKSDVKAEALRDASLDLPLSILDDQLAERFAKAFAFHPWVAGVKQVRKISPAGIEVDLEYRRPVCMVELPAQGGLYAVDVEGFLLPTRDFLDDPRRALVYPRLSGVSSVNIGRVGVRWADPVVQDGARLAAAVEPVWDKFAFLRIVPAVASSRPDGRPQFELHTRGGTCVLWGSAPGAETGDELPAAEKLTALARFADAQGSLDQTPPQRIDLRGRQAVLAATSDETSRPAEVSAAKTTPGSAQK